MITLPCKISWLSNAPLKFFCKVSRKSPPPPSCLCSQIRKAANCSFSPPRNPQKSHRVCGHSCAENHLVVKKPEPPRTAADSATRFEPTAADSTPFEPTAVDPTAFKPIGQGNLPVTFCQLGLLVTAKRLLGSLVCNAQACKNWEEHSTMERNCKGRNQLWPQSQRRSRYHSLPQKCTLLGKRLKGLVTDWRLWSLVAMERKQMRVLCVPPQVSG